MTHSRFRDLLDRLRNKVPVAIAIVIIGPRGVLDHLKDATFFDVDVFAAEYATLLRIARRTSDDAGTGGLVEHIVVSETSVTIARQIASDYFLLLVSKDREHLGRARYEVKQVARDLAKIL
jgi:predicted regulator of Ras-like GTPase activity (Roadblock/LC7/MglB family)